MKIIGFFSFKGGVGRTALMVNTGAYWARKGFTVLLVDMDLFAPGLTYSPLKGNYLFPEGQGLGISDLLAAFAKRKSGTEEVPFLPPHLLIREMNLPRRKLLRKEGRLLMIDAGRSLCDIRTWQGAEKICGDYAEGAPLPTIRSKKPDEDEGPDSLAYRSLARYIRDDLGKTEIPPFDEDGKPRKIDYVLIDCRTGFPELLDLNLGYLAENMVIVSGLNDQNLSGLRETFTALDQRVEVGNLPAVVTVVFSPVPAGEDQAVFDSLKKAHEVIRDSLRPTRYETPESPPVTRVIHYTPILALNDALLVFDQPDSLYSREVTAIADELEGGIEEEDKQDRLVKKVRQDTFALLGDVKKRETVIEKERETAAGLLEANPLAQMPPWYWPLHEPGIRIEVLENIMPVNENVPEDREILLNKLCWSISLNSDEKSKISKSYDRLNEEQIKGLSSILDQEKRKFMITWNNQPENRRWIFEIYFESQKKWGYLIGPSKEDASKIFLESPFEGKGVFPDWEKQAVYWLLLGKEHYKVYKKTERLWESIECAYRAGGEKEKIDVSLRILEIFTIDTVQKDLREKVEERTITESHSDAEVMLRIAEACMEEKPGRRDRAIEMLNRVVDRIETGEITDARLCQSAAALILDHVNELVPRCEMVLRRAITLDPKLAYPWNGLGNLFAQNLGRYDEAEAAYKKAIELDPKLAYPWKGLGNLYKELKRLDEAEAAYKKAIELDPRFAYPWNGLGNLYKELKRLDEAEAAYKKAIELDPKYAHPWNGLALLYQGQNRFQDARRAYDNAIEIDPAYLTPLHNDAELALVENDPERVEKRLKEASILLKSDEDKRNHVMLELALSLAKADKKEIPKIQENLVNLNTRMETPSTWNYEDMKPFTRALPPAAQNLLNAWINTVKHQPGQDPHEAYEEYVKKK